MWPNLIIVMYLHKNSTLIYYLMEFNKDYAYILYENPPQALLNDSLLAKKVIISYLSIRIYNDMQFLNNIFPHLQSMKMKTNGDNDNYYYYLQFSTFVAQISICKVRKELQDPARTWDIVNVIGKLDMENEFRESQYEGYRKLLEKECRRMGILPSLIDYGLLTRILIVLVSAVITCMMTKVTNLSITDSLFLGILNGSIFYLHTKK